MRERREKEQRMRELQSKRAKRQVEERQRLKLMQLQKLRMETLKRKGISGQSPIPSKQYPQQHHKPGSKGSSRAPTPDHNRMAHLMDVPDMDLQGLIMNPLDPDSYLA
jgi:hypothetical protein